MILLGTCTLLYVLKEYIPDAVFYTTLNVVLLNVVFLEDGLDEA